MPCSIYFDEKPLKKQNLYSESEASIHYNGAIIKDLNISICYWLVEVTGISTSAIPMS